MTPDVKGSRPYDSTRRREQARQTRLAVLDTSRRLFLEHGYAETTVAEVASQAGVSVETVYKSFRNKAGLVKALFDVLVVGDDEAIPMMQRESIRHISAEPDPRKKLMLYGAHTGKVGPRVGPVLLVVRQAAANDPGAASVWQQVQGERLAGMEAFADHLHQGGHLRVGVSPKEARDVLWAHNSVELWDLLVNQREWSNHRFGNWVGQQLIAALL